MRIQEAGPNFPIIQFSNRFRAIVRLFSTALMLLTACSLVVQAQVSGAAYRVLGQPDLRGNGLNAIQGTELNTPLGVALDSRGGQTHLYIADTANSRVLAWADVNSYQAGDSPALILGQ